MITNRVIIVQSGKGWCRHEYEKDHEATISSFW